MAPTGKLTPSSVTTYPHSGLVQGSWAIAKFQYEYILPRWSKDTPAKLINTDGRQEHSTMGHDGAVTEKTLHDQTNILPRAQLLIVFSTLAVTLLICFIDQNGISVALPTIAEDLDAQQTVSWAGTSSLIANTVFQMIYGRLVSIFSSRTKL